MKKERILGIFSMVWGTIFGFLETNYFGNNFLPQTSSELICDISSLVMVIAGYFLFIMHPNKNE